MRGILWLSIALATAAYICNPIQDPDLWWHIVVGRWIVAHHDIPTVDYWGMFSVGQPWRAYSWAVEILFALVEKSAGIHGLLTLKLLLASALALSLFYVYGRMASSWFIGALLGLYSTVACFNHFTLRPQSFVWIYFAWLLYHASKWERQERPVVPVAFVVLMLLWANTHLSSALGIVAVAAWLWPRERGTEPYRKLGLGVGACFLGTLLTPYLGGEWITLFHKSAHPFIFRNISEFVPANILQFSTIFLVLLLVFLAAFIGRSSRVIGHAKMIGFALFVLGAFAVVKFLPFAVIYGCAVVALVWREKGNGADLEGNLSGGLIRLQNLYERMAGQGLALVVIAIIILRVMPLWQAPLDLQITPQGAVDVIEENRLPGPLANTFGQGGYLIYRFSDKAGNPRQLVAIDGRTNLISEELWAKYSETNRGWLRWREYLDLIRPRTILWRSDSPLVAVLLASGEWCLIYRQGANIGSHVVLLKKDEFLLRQPALKSANCSFMENAS